MIGFQQIGQILIFYYKKLTSIITREAIIDELYDKMPFIMN